MGKGQLFNIWADGSFRGKSGLIGAGWMVRAPGQEYTGSYLAGPLGKDELPYGSEIAEMMAAAYAVERIPAGAAIKLHMDSQNIGRMLTQRQISKRQRGVIPLCHFFDQAMQAMRRAGSFDVVHVSGKNPNLASVYELAKTATTPAPAPAR